MAYGSESSSSVALLANGKMLLAGTGVTFTTRTDFEVARYNRDGTADTSFGTNGHASADFGRNDYCTAMAVQPDGKIMLGGTLDFGPGPLFGAARLNADGTLDTTFGSGGKAVTNITGYDSHGFSVALQSDGKVLMAGDALIPNPDSPGILIPNAAPGVYFAVIRYNVDGTLDDSFGTGGKVITAIGSGRNSAKSVAVQSDGKIVIAGSSAATSTSSSTFAVVRYNTDGSLDTTFGTNGEVTTAVGNGGSGATSLLVQSDGKLMVAGSSFDGTPSGLALVRYAADGSLDSSSGDGGTEIIASVAGAKSMAAQSDGKLVVIGTSYVGINPTTTTPFIARFNADGSLDPEFDNAGQISPVNQLSTASGVAIQCDGNIVIAGSIGANATLARFHGAASSDDPPPPRLTSPLTQTLLTKGQPVPGAGSDGIPAAATWVKLGVPVTNDASDLAFLASTETLTGIFAGPATAPILIAAKGANAPNGDGLFPDHSPIFSTFKDPLLDENHKVAFLATLTGPGVNSTNNTGIWSNAFSTLKLIARTGDDAVGIPGARWKSLTNVALPGGTIGIVFTAQLVIGPGGVTPANDTGLWTVDTADPFSLILRTGDLVDGKKLQSFKVLSATPGSHTPAHSYNTVGEIVYKATFTDGTQSIIKVTVP